LSRDEVQVGLVGLGGTLLLGEDKEVAVEELAFVKLARSAM